MSKPTPQFLVAADSIIEMPGGRIILIDRLNYPFGWAFPGGIVELGETVEQAAIREAKEETSLDIELKYLLGVYSKPDRDPRGPIISLVFVACQTYLDQVPKAKDDAKDIKLYKPEQLPDNIAFDHRDIINDYVRKILPY